MKIKTKLIIVALLPGLILAAVVLMEFRVQDRLELLDEQVRQYIHTVLLLTGGTVFLLVLIAIFITSGIISGINRSLKRLHDGFHKVAQGDLCHRLQLERKDEFGALARCFDEMTEQLTAVTVSRDALARESADRRLAQESLSISDSQFKEAQRLAHIGSWELNLRTHAVRLSEEAYRIFGLEPQPLPATAEDFLAVIHPEDRQMVQQAQSDSLKTRTPFAIAHRLLMRDGTSKFVLQRSETTYDTDGTPVISRGTVEDITERKITELELQRLNAELEARVHARTAELESKARQVEDTQRALMNIVEDLNEKTAELEAVNVELQGLDKLKSMFIASMSHELRTPLNSIIGFSSIVLNEWLGPLNDEQKAKMATVLRTGKHLLTLINDVIDVSKIEAGKLEFHLDSLSLPELMHEAVALIQKECSDKNIILREETVPIQLQTDRRRLFQCLVNLLSNAVKFTERGSILVKNELVDPGRVRITICDSGIGIPAEDMPKLFNAFTRLNSRLTSSVGGTGLGLYLVKKITGEILKGTVGAESSVGKGSSFFIEIPITHPQGESTHENGTGG